MLSFNTTTDLLYASCQAGKDDQDSVTHLGDDTHSPWGRQTCIKNYTVREEVHGEVITGHQGSAGRGWKKSWNTS